MGPAEVARAHFDYYGLSGVEPVHDPSAALYGPMCPDGRLPPDHFMTLDGTLYVDPAGKPWLVYAHEWLQKTDGTMETVRLSDDLVRRVGDPMLLFKPSDAPWLDQGVTPSTAASHYVTDGPELYRTWDGHLLMLKLSFRNISGFFQEVSIA